LSRKILLNILMTFLIPATFLFVGLTLIFIFVRLMPGDPTSAYLPINATIEQREAVRRYLGLDQPIIIQYLRYIGDFLTGNLGLSSSISRGQPVINLLGERNPRTYEVMILPLLIGGGLGYLISRISKRSKRNWSKNVIQILCALLIAAPIFLIGMFSQYIFAYVVRWFPAVGYKTAGYPDPTLITGFRLLDSLLTGHLYLIADTMYHYALPMIILTLVITAIMTRFFSSNRVKDSYKKNTILSNTAKTSVTFGVLLTLSILIETTFNLKGFGNLMISAIVRYDFFMIQGVLITILVLLAITILVSNLAFSLYGLRRDRHPEEGLEEPTEVKLKPSSKEDVLNYLKQIVRSPLSIIGIIAVMIPIIMSIFPGLISGYTFEQTRGFYVGAWAPPSPGHLLGTGYLGRDVLAQILYGIRDSLIFGAGAVLVGLIGGSIFGLLASRFTRKLPTIIKSVTLVFYVFPGLVLLILFVMMIGHYVWLLALITGLLLIPSFTRIIANTEFRVVPIWKKVVSYLPLFAGFAILLYVTIGFLGFADSNTIQLGNLVAVGRYHLYDAPWATFWPGFATFLLLISLFVLHEGLVKDSR